ncbi:MAG: hypothetical protein H7256_16210, partial [Bdellovibrio sp.]|nr:hypothetical protein [Bdellovibrio sp.]
MRTLVLVIYFVLFQVVILLQKPFLQTDFMFAFYASFAVLFLHHMYLHFFSDVEISTNVSFFSYGFDFFVMILFMRSFPQLSSFLLVIQLFLLFIASFDLKFTQLCGLGLLASVGVSLMNLTVFQVGSTQNILSLALFNLSYLAVIIVSGQLKDEIYGMQDDLTTVRRKFKSQAEFSKVLVEKMPLGLIVSQNNDTVLMKNKFFSENLNLNDSEVNRLAEITREQKSSSDISFLKSTQERRIFQFDRTDYFDEDLSEKLNISLIRDVTDLRKLEADLKQKEKLAAIGQLAAGIAHEIRNPLAGISGSIQLLTTDNVESEDQKKLMKIILKEIDRLNNLITEFLDYAKPEQKPDQFVQLTMLLEETIQNVKLNPKYADLIEWSVQLTDQRILGFSEKLKQAFLNMIINAVQATEGRSPRQVKVSLNQINGAV